MALNLKSLLCRYCSFRTMIVYGDTNIQKYPYGKSHCFDPGPLGAVWRGLLIRWVIRRGVPRWDQSWPHVTGSRLGIIRQACRVGKHAGTLWRHVFQYSVFFQYSFVFISCTSKKIRCCCINLAEVFCIKGACKEV